MEKFHKHTKYKGKIFSLSIKNKILKFGAKTRTYAETGVSIGQPTSKNHNYFYTQQNEVIQIPEFSYGSLLSTKNIIKMQTHLY